MIKSHQYLSQIESYKAGKSTLSGVKLSSNENALGSSEKALAAYKNHAPDAFRYFEGSCVLLREALAVKYKIASDRIVCGAGSDELLALITQAFAGVGDEVIYSRHGFLMYPISAKRVGAVGVVAPEKNLKTDIAAILAAITPKTKIIFIANPNNPTGSYLNKNEIAQLIDGVPKNILIVLDHAYDEFAQGVEDYPDAIKLVEENENIVMTRTFSKIHGLASLRVGWGYFSQEIAEILHKIRGPFNVSGPAQVAAVASLKDDEFFEKSLKHNKKWLEKFNQEIAGFAKIKNWPSIANFILLDFEGEEKCRRANEIMLERGFILREMQSYHLPNCLRMTIGSDEENERILAILREIDGLI